MDRKYLFVASILLVSSLITYPAYATFHSAIIDKDIHADGVTSADIDNYWTPERLKNAKPMPLPQIDRRLVKEVPLSDLQNQSLVDDKSEGGDGHPPVENTHVDFQHLFVPKENSLFEKQKTKLQPATLDRGSLKYEFSSSRLVPATADLSYPYRTVGKLFFTIPGDGDYVCSASVLRPRILLTAGHCVHKGSGGTKGFYTNWKFVPAYRDGDAPFQTWNFTYVATTSTWATGSGIVPNAADYGMLELEDRNFNGKILKIGSVTGYLGYQTLSLIPNHLHLLGYPCNFDDCEQMHQVTAQSAIAVSPNNVEYGSDMRGGSSGGPWVQNFGQFSMGQDGGLNSGINRIVAVTSYGYMNYDPKAQGASIFDSRFSDLLKKLCSHKADNC